MATPRVQKKALERQPEPERPACMVCNGTGLVYGGFKYRKTCPDCQGTRYATTTFGGL